MRRPARVNDAVVKKQACTLLILLRFKNHRAVRAVLADTGIGCLNVNGPPKLFGARSDIESMQPLKIIAVRVLAHRHNVYGAVRSGMNINYGRGGHANLGYHLEAVPWIGGSFAILQQRIVSVNRSSIRIEGINTV